MNGLLAQPQQPPQGQPKGQPEGQGRKASPQEQQAYKTLVSQVLGFIASPEVTAKLEETIQKVGPDRALAMIIMQALQMVGQAAKGAGVDIATHTGKAAIKEIVSVLAAMLQASGLVESAQNTTQGVMQLIAEGMFGQQNQPGQGAQGQPAGQPAGQRAGAMPPQDAQPQMGM